MTFLQAAEKADEAKKFAGMAWRDADGSNGDDYLATAVKHLSEAVAELARALPRSDLN